MNNRAMVLRWPRVAVGAVPTDPPDPPDYSYRLTRVIDIKPGMLLKGMSWEWGDGIVKSVRLATPEEALWYVGKVAKVLVVDTETANRCHPRLLFWWRAQPVHIALLGAAHPDAPLTWCDAFDPDGDLTKQVFWYEAPLSDAGEVIAPECEHSYVGSCPFCLFASARLATNSERDTRERPGSRDDPAGKW